MSLHPPHPANVFLDNILRGAEVAIRDRIIREVRPVIDRIIEEEAGRAALEVRQIFNATDMDNHIQIAIVKPKEQPEQ